MRGAKQIRRGVLMLLMFDFLATSHQITRKLTQERERQRAREKKRERERDIEKTRTRQIAKSTWIARWWMEGHSLKELEPKISLSPDCRHARACGVHGRNQSETRAHQISIRTTPQCPQSLRRVCFCFCSCGTCQRLTSC